VILVQVGHDRGADIGRGVPERGELGGEGVLLADAETGEAIVDEPGEPAWEIGVIDNRGPVLPGIEQDEALGMLDDVGVDRPRRRPLAGRQQPPVQRLLRAVRMSRC
jgi:hypothetical protein